MDRREQEYIAEIKLGEEAEKFFKSDIGRYVLGRAAEEIDQALTEFKSVDPDDATSIRKLQFKIAVSEKIPIWVNEIMLAGEQAMQIIDQGEE